MSAARIIATTEKFDEQENLSKELQRRNFWKNTKQTAAKKRQGFADVMAKQQKKMLLGL